MTYEAKKTVAGFVFSSEEIQLNETYFVTVNSSEYLTVEMTSGLVMAGNATDMEGGFGRGMGGMQSDGTRPSRDGKTPPNMTDDAHEARR